MKRRNFILACAGAVAGFKATMTGNEYRKFVQNTEDYIQPNNELVQEAAENIDNLHYKADIGFDLEYEADYEDFKKPERYLEEGVGDCEDHAVTFASVFEYLEKDWKITVEPGHIAVEFVHDNYLYEINVGEPKTPVSTEGAREYLMYSLEDGWESYCPDWPSSDE